MNTRTGKLTQIALNAAPSPSWLCFNKNKTVLYAINEITDGTATAYRVNPDNGRLTLFSTQPCASTAEVATAARGPAHASVHASGNFLLTSQYGGASIGVLPINDDGSLGPATDTIVHTGDYGPGQTQAHPHMTVSDPSGKYVISQDLGQDRTYIYSLNESTGKLTPGPTPFVASQSGSGPRHLAFHPDGIHMYSICELGGLINVYFWNPDTGSLLLQQTISTLPEDYAGRIQCSEIQVAADGDTVYAANRGFDSIVAYSARDYGASLAGTRPRWTWTRGQTPRHFTLDPTGKFLLSGNQDSNNIVTFSVNWQGELKYEGEFFANTKPACILFL
ncbi:MAG: pgl 3 [Bryobacterales bacterium]|nr:pgl 3 [Bryobacterales bacterium]